MPQSEITKVLSKRLEELTESKRDNDYKLSDKKQAEQMGIPYATFVKYKGDNAECPASAIVKIAEYYNVSTDYLLGRTNNPSQDMKLRKSCDYMGISQRSGENIRAVTQSGGNVDILLESDEFKDIVDLLNTIKIILSATQFFRVRIDELSNNCINELNVETGGELVLLEEMYGKAIAAAITRPASKRSTYISGYRNYKDQLILAEYDLTEKVIRKLIDNIENNDPVDYVLFTKYDIDVERNLEETLSNLQDELTQAPTQFEGEEHSKRQDEIQNNIKSVKALIDFHNKKYNGKD